MYLSSFDTYWVNWYTELYQRLAVNYSLSGLPCREREANPEFHTLFCTMVGKVQLVCRRNLTRNEESILEKTIDDEIIKPVCSKCTDLECTYRKPGRLKEIIDRTYAELKDYSKRCGLLHPIEFKDLRLFGERKSRPIGELTGKATSRNIESGPPYIIPNGITRETGPTDGIRIQWNPDVAGRNEDEPSYHKIFAVPYNANISFIVCRSDLLQRLRGAIKTDSLIASMKQVYKSIERASAEVGIVDAPQKTLDEVVEALAVRFREDVENLPETWEGVVSLCELGSKILNRRMKLLIETKTFDTIICTLLELVWSSGKELRVSADYAIRDRNVVTDVLFRAFYLLHRMFQKGIVPLRLLAGAPGLGNSVYHVKFGLALARHWYSTFVDWLTARRTHGDGQTELIWKPDSEVSLDIMPIPVSLRSYVEQSEMHGRVQRRDVKSENGPFRAKHVACWGEWYLGIMRGTENKQLAVDLINNLMSSRKICDRAFSCAALPTVEKFYEMYGDAGCFNLPERDPRLLPRRTFTSMRSSSWMQSPERIYLISVIVCELHSVVEYIRASVDITPKELYKRVKDATDGIEARGKQGMLLRWERQPEAV